MLTRGLSICLRPARVTYNHFNIYRQTVFIVLPVKGSLGLIQLGSNPRFTQGVMTTKISGTMYFLYVLFLPLLNTITTMVESSPAPPVDDICNEAYTSHLNSLGLGWRAGRNLNQRAISNYLQQLRSTEFDEEAMRTESLNYNLSAIPVSFSYQPPTYFDAREKWNCSSISEIRTQGCCGSCWAIAAAATMSDRQCIHSQGRDQVRYSTDDLLCVSNSGCNGLPMQQAWNYWQTTGIVSEGCKPYSYKPCSGEQWNQQYNCKPLCQPGYYKDYKRDKHFGQYYFITQGIKQEEMLMRDLLENGPIEVDFQFYKDLFCYKSGVYQPSPGAEQANRHAVKLIGWGVENQIPYWLVANSYGTSWGKKGFFKIRRGVSDFGKFGVTGVPVFK